MEVKPDHEAQQAIYQEIADALFLSVPDGWNEIQLSLVVLSAEQHKVEISGPGGCPAQSTPDDSLYLATYRLVDLFIESGRLFREVVIGLVSIEGGDDWKISAAYDYGDIKQVH